MKFYPHNLNDSELCYVTVRVSNEEHKALREWMKTHPRQPCVSFPHGVRLERRNSGWFRLNPSNVHLGAEKLTRAYAILRKFAHEYRRARDAEERCKRSVTQTDTQRVVAFVSDAKGGTYHVRKKPIHAPQHSTQHTTQHVSVDKKVSEHRLLALQQRFSR